MLQQKVLAPNEFESFEELENKILSFQTEYEKVSKPFEWKFTRDDLKKLLSRFEEENTVVILQPTLDVDMKNQLKARLVDVGKVYSPVRNTARTHPQFDFWYDPSFQGLFEPVRGTW